MAISKKTRVTLKRIFWVFVPAVLVLGVGLVALDFYVIHTMAHPPRTQLYGSPRDFQVILQKPMWSEEKWNNTDSTETYGWFLSRGRPAPAIILSHAYGSNRSELLTLTFELWKAGYHVLVYDMRGHGESPINWSGLGTYEVDDVLSAIKFLRGLRSDGGEELLDGRIGLYGVDLGGYVSLVASTQDPSVKAVAVDSVYPDIASFIKNRLNTFVGTEGWANRIVESEWTSRLTEVIMQVYLMRREDSALAMEAVLNSSGRRFLFLAAEDPDPVSEMTRDLHDKTRDTKEFVAIEHTRQTRLYDRESASYDAKVVEFFREALPVATDRPGGFARATR